MPFGLSKAQSKFLRMMDQVLADIPFVIVYLGNVTEFSNSVEEKIEPVKTVMEFIVSH